VNSKIQSNDIDAQNINWESVFNLAINRSLKFESGDALRHGNLVAALKTAGKASNNATAGKAIRQAVMDDEIQEIENGYKIVRDGPGTGDIRQSLKRKLQEIMKNEGSGVIQSPTSSGKTYTPSTRRWRLHSDITGDQPVILFSGTTDARDEAVKKSRDSWVSSEVLKGRTDACPLARGDYDSDNELGNTAIRSPDRTEPSEWFDKMCDDRGLPVSVAHGEFERAYEGELPCCEDNDCPSSTQWTDIPRNDRKDHDYDILHATHPFAQVPQLIDGCNLILDERPDFTLNMTTDGLRKKIKRYFTEIDAQIQTWEDLVVNIVQGTGDIDLDQLREELEVPDTDWFRYNREAHALTPGIVEAIIHAEERNHDRWVGETRYTFPTLIPNYDGPEHEVILRIVFDSEYHVRLLQAIPDFTEARSVIGLDAHPTMPKWKANTLSSIEKNQIINSDDNHKWRRNQRNLTIVQVGDNKNTWTKKDFSDPKVRILCDELRHKYENGFRTGITAKRFTKDLQQHLTNAGVDSPDTLYFGNEKSVEDFDSEQAGLVAGCISPSSDHIKDWIALLDKDAKPKRDVEDSYQGQKWVGEDADVAEELLADIRENGVLQACGRYARSPQQPDDGAIVYVLTNVLPDEYADKQVDDVSVFGKKEMQILDYVLSHDGVTPNRIDQETDASRKHVHDTLNKCRDYSWLHVDENAGEYNADVFYADRRPDGLVEV